MPIRAERRHLYPPRSEWRAIRERVLARAGNACAWCRAPNRCIVARGTGLHAGTYRLADGRIFDDQTGEWLDPPQGYQYRVRRFIKVVLTVAHLDHDPTHNGARNLVALCQHCHLRYDQSEHETNAAATRARERDEETGQQYLFVGGSR